MIRAGAWELGRIVARGCHLSDMGSLGVRERLFGMAERPFPRYERSSFVTCKGLFRRCAVDMRLSGRFGMWCG